MRRANRFVSEVHAGDAGRQPRRHHARRTTRHTSSSTRATLPVSMTRGTTGPDRNGAARRSGGVTGATGASCSTVGEAAGGGAWTVGPAARTQTGRAASRLIGRCISTSRLLSSRMGAADDRCASATSTTGASIGQSSSPADGCHHCTAPTPASTSGTPPSASRQTVRRNTAGRRRRASTIAAPAAAQRVTPHTALIASCRLIGAAPCSCGTRSGWPSGPPWSRAVSPGDGTAACRSARRTGCRPACPRWPRCTVPA